MYLYLDYVELYIVTLVHVLCVHRKYLCTRSDKKILVENVEAYYKHAVHTLSIQCCVEKAQEYF